MTITQRLGCTIAIVLAAPVLMLASAAMAAVGVASAIRDAWR